ncbi:TPA: hypothetical protein ACJGLG_001516 [Salmonella enterica subsp. enterica serovar Typhimurium]|uniref:Uncharacterized protein n=1 Tax=Salmonella enterica I TaxID=59201 RepID=A0A612H786_SALET|nr:hypothetical protein [Salmonella enterica subsp. enterica]EHJ3658415.1 hypothetical protein [Salmonella enterica]HDO5799905.1 hypothetical protein [Salmonella enterica subsp. enterica serovar Typhimurium]HED0202226.1 hypothetical protein [Salmonella enterica subsp. enterica serovar Orientalis]
MTNLTIPLCFALIIFSPHACAVTPDNRADVIRKNVQTVTPLQSLVGIKSKSYSLNLDNNKMVTIPAGRTLTIPPDEARNIITHVVNYNNIQEAGKIKTSDNMLFLE